jgi:membrane associated rhomboid family serine protease
LECGTRGVFSRFAVEDKETNAETITMPTNPFERALQALRRSDIPVSLALIAAMVATFTISMLGGARFLIDAFGFFAPGSLARPWTLFTFSSLTLFPDILSLLFNGLFLWWFGGSLERAWSSRGFAAFWFAASAVTALSMSLGAAVIGSVFSTGPTLPMMALFVSASLTMTALLMAWAALNPEQVIHFYGIIPIKAKFLAMGYGLYIFFSYAAMHPALGFFALGGSAFAIWWARFFAGRWSKSHYSTYAAPPRKDTFFRKEVEDEDTAKAGAWQRPKFPKKILTPLDDRRTWKDWSPLAAYQRYKRRKQFERLLQDDD